MIDFHAHIIPNIDDGAKSLSVSVDMLRMLEGQGVSTVVLTPHFYPGEESVTAFLERRERQLELLQAELSKTDEHFPQMAVGAEVFYFRTIYSLEDIEKLCILGTNYLLLEMPFQKWTESVIESVHKLISNCGITPIIAHVDRYIDFGNGTDEIKQLKELGAVIQVNADFFETFMLKRKIFSYFKKSLADVLGSDCHSTGVRRSNLDKAVSLIENQLGKDIIKKINVLSENILKGAVIK